MNGSPTQEVSLDVSQPRTDNVVAKDLNVSNLTVCYGNTEALHNITFKIAPGEFISILGPSGCGKTTLLRSIAGLEPVSSGEVRIGGRDVANFRPKDRQVAFVFQSYALYPHMTCRENLAAPLVMMDLPAAARIPLIGRFIARVKRRGIAQRVDATAELLEISPYLDRRPAALSGGQRQRVALGRALIREPHLFLLDEPLANLDASLRNKTRSELLALQRRVGATTLFVTHDQSEAMAISDRVIVIFAGRIRQIGTPDELYRNPVDIETAVFLSQPHLNIISTDAFRDAIGYRTLTTDIEVAGRPLAEIDGDIAFRPEHADIRPLDIPGPPGLQVTVDHAEHGGVEANLFVRHKTDSATFVVRIPSQSIGTWPPGTSGVLHFDLASAYFFSPDGTAAPALRLAV